MDEKVELSLTLKLFNITKTELAHEMGYSFSQVVCALKGTRSASPRFWNKAYEAMAVLLQKQRAQAQEQAQLTQEEYIQAIQEIEGYGAKT